MKLPRLLPLIGLTLADDRDGVIRSLIDKRHHCTEFAATISGLKLNDLAPDSDNREAGLTLVRANRSTHIETDVEPIPLTPGGDFPPSIPASSRRPIACSQQLWRRRRRVDPFPFMPPTKLRSSLLTFTLLAAFPLAQSVLAQSSTPVSTSFAPVILPITRASDAPLTVTLDHADWTYSLGTPANFRITINTQPYPAGGVPIKYRIGPEMREGAEQDAIVPAAGLVITAAAPAEPGFIRCIVTATIGGKPVRDLATAGYAPEKIRPTQTEPADFDAFWSEQKAALAKVSPDYQLTPAPELSTPTVEVSYLSFQNVGGWSGPSRFYGVLCVPRGPGPFPAVMSPPGAGVRPYTGMRSLAEKGVITLQVGIHGIPVNLPKELYDQLYRGALMNYNRINLDDRNTYYYRRVYLGCLRANDYLTSHPKWDGKNLLMLGGSQGGQLSIVTTALDPRVTALAASYPAYSDVTGYLRGRTGGWPGLFRPDRDGHPGDAPIEAKVITTTYYDTVNFARRLKVPGLYFWGYNDETCPPTSTFTAYNVITAPKQLMLALEQGHATSPVQQEKIEAWVLAQFQSK